jgi:hypothetical protein
MKPWAGHAPVYLVRLFPRGAGAPWFCASARRADSEDAEFFGEIAALAAYFERQLADADAGSSQEQPSGDGEAAS